MQKLDLSVFKQKRRWYEKIRVALFNFFDLLLQIRIFANGGYDWIIRFWNMRPFWFLFRKLILLVKSFYERILAMFKLKLICFFTVKFKHSYNSRFKKYHNFQRESIYSMYFQKHAAMVPQCLSICILHSNITSPNKNWIFLFSDFPLYACFKFQIWLIKAVASC